MIINVVNFNAGVSELPPAPVTVNFIYDTYNYENVTYYRLKSIDCSGYPGINLTIPASMKLDGTNTRPIMFKDDFFNNSKNLWGNVSDLYIGFRPIIFRSATTRVDINLPSSIKNLHLFNPFPIFTDDSNLETYIFLSWFKNCEKVFFPVNFSFSYLYQYMFWKAINPSSILSNEKFGTISQIDNHCFNNAVFSPNYIYQNENLTNMGKSTFAFTSNLEKFIAPNCLTCGERTFEESKHIKYIDIGLQAIPLYFARNVSSLEKLILRNSEGVVSVGNNSFDNTIPNNCQIYVPDGLYDSYLSDSLWSTISTRIHRISELG